MKFLEQEINGVYLIQPEPVEDCRGLLRRHFCQREFREFNLFTDIKQTNISENRRKYTLRGFHYQLPPHGENKLISCIKGSIYDIVVDARPNSPTFCKWIQMELSEENRLSLLVPDGCANAYLTLENHTWILYFHSEFYFPSAELGIRYNDPIFNFKWPAEPSVISDKDKSIPLFNLKEYSP